MSDNITTKNPASITSIISCGINSSIGSTSTETFATLQSCLANFEQFKINDEKTTLLAKINDEYLFMLPPDSAVVELHPKNQRLLQIAVPAITESLSKFNAKGLGNQNIPLFLGLPEEDSDAAKVEQNTLIPWLKNLSGLNIDTKKSQFFPNGRASGIIALHNGIEYLQNSDCDCVIIGAVDTYFDPKILNDLYLENRLTSYNDNNGFIPGEAAVFIVITASSGLEKLKIAGIAATNIGIEESKRASFVDAMPKGLGNIVNAMYKNCDVEKITTKAVFPPFNGEKEWLYEWGPCQEINQDYIDVSSCPFEIPSSFIGDTGAAHGLMKLAIAADSISQQVMSGPVLICSSSDNQHRAAALIV